MYEVSVTGRFRAAHQLRYQDGSQEPLHEHDWRVTITVAGEKLDELGLLTDFGLLRDRLNAILSRLEGQVLNQVPPFDQVNPSAENVVLYVRERLLAALPPQVWLECAEVEEEPGCVARYRSAAPPGA